MGFKKHSVRSAISIANVYYVLKKCFYVHILIFMNIQFLGGLSLHLNHLYSAASERSLSAIWDTSHWNFFVKFGLRTA